jgi:protein MpaA
VASDELVDVADRATIHHEPTNYGTSLAGAELLAYLPATWSEQRTLVMAGIHGEEAGTTHVVSSALRRIRSEHLRAAVIVGANPDGLAAGTRGNHRGVDLNRNFPAANWSPAPALINSGAGEGRQTKLSTGDQPASEPEAAGLLELIETQQIEQVVSLHAPLSCVDCASDWELADELAERLGLKRVRDIGHPMTGSMGSWASEAGIRLITLEIEDLALVEIRRKYGPVLHELLTGRIPGL